MALAGEWLPCRHDEWYNNAPGKHRNRAKMPHTKMTYDADGNGHGSVGEFNLVTKATQIAPGQFTFTSRLTTGGWSATDGRGTLLSDGTFLVKIPSNGITEYWHRADGRGHEVVEYERNEARKIALQNNGKPRRNLSLVFRHFGSKTTDYFWHWALGVDDDVYEVAASMAVMGPRGVVAANCFVIPKKTNLNSFDGYLPLDTTTQATDEDIQNFVKEWVDNHPAYGAMGPNCQTFAEDFHTFLSGRTLPFRKFSDRVGKKDAEGPESHPLTVWINPHARPSYDVEEPKSLAYRLGRMLGNATKGSV